MNKLACELGIISDITESRARMYEIKNNKIMSAGMYEAMYNLVACEVVTDLTQPQYDVINDMSSGNWDDIIGVIE